MLKFVENFISDNQLEKSIRYLGTVDGQEKNDLLNSSKVFVLSSYSEGFSIAVLEALVYQIPVVVSTETGLSNEIYDYKAGFVIDLNVDSIADGIVEILQNEILENEMAKNGLKLVVEKFETFKVCSLFDQEAKKIFVNR